MSKYCQHCGKKIEDRESKTCPYCGKDLDDLSDEEIMMIMTMMGLL